MALKTRKYKREEWTDRFFSDKVIKFISFVGVTGRATDLDQAILLVREVATGDVLFYTLDPCRAARDVSRWDTGAEISLGTKFTRDGDLIVKTQEYKSRKSRNPPG